MATEKRLIDANELAKELTYDRDQDCNRYQYWYQKEERDAKYNFAIDRVNEAPTVDAVEVDEIKIHHILIDNEGVPEVKLQIGDRYFAIRTDPVEVRSVVHGRWEDNDIPSYGLRKCSVCGFRWGTDSYTYCPKCAATMDGERKKDFFFVPYRRG